MTVEWVPIHNVSLAVAARRAGFDIAIYEHYSPEVRTEVRRLSIKEAMKELCERYEAKAKKPLREVTRGTYIIRLGWPLTIQYKLRKSNVLYIGEGSVKTRLDAHFEHSLFDVMQSLNGTDFSFYIAEPRLRNAEDYYQHLEYLLLEEFKEKYGGDHLPLLNRQNGSFRGNYCRLEGWSRPLKNTRQEPRWALRQTEHNEFRPLD